MNKSSILVAFFAQAILLGWLVYRDWCQGQIQANNQSNIAVLTQTLDNATAAIEQQSSVLDRTLGKVVPVKMPDAWSTQLSALENAVESSKEWPQTRQDAQLYLDKTKDLISKLPAWAEDEYLPRLNVVRWAAMAFTTLNPPDDNDGDNQARFETLAALLESAPDGVNANLLERVASEQNQLLSIVNDEEWKMLRDRTRGYIANPEKAPIDEIKEDIATLISYSNTGETSRRDEVKKLVRDLQRILIQYKAAEQGISLTSRIQLITKLKEKDPNLFQTAMSEILSEVRLTRANLALFGSGDESLDMLDKQLTAELKDQQIKALNDQESVRAKLVRNYQKYALQSIKRFNQRYANREKITNDVLTRIREGNRLANDYDDLPSVQYAIMNAKYRKIEGRVYDTEEYILGTTDSLESDLNYYVCRDAMVSHLLPIDLRLTEMPIQDLFQKAWQSGWENLDGREDQTVVAVRTADVKKKTLTDVQVEK